MKSTALLLSFSLLCVFQKAIAADSCIEKKQRFTWTHLKHQYAARTSSQEDLKTRANKALFQLHRQQARTYNWQRDLIMYHESDKRFYTVFDYIAAGNYDTASLMFEQAYKNVSEVKSCVMQEIYTSTAQLFESASKAPHSLSFSAVSQQCIATELLYKKYPQYADFVPFFIYTAEFFISKEREMLSQKKIAHQQFSINE